MNKTVAGRPYRTETSTMSYSQATMNNARRTAEGKRADAAARRASGSGDGRAAGHRHSASGGAPPSDTANIYRQNSIQNGAGGTKHHVERTRDNAMRQDPSLKVQERSTLVYSPDRPGYGNKVPIAEKVEQSYVRDGQVVRQSNVTFANTSTSASRAAEKLKSEGRTLSRADRERLDAQDRKHFGTTMQDQARAAQMRSQETSSQANRRSMAQQLASQAPSSNVQQLRPTQKQGRTPKLP